MKKLIIILIVVLFSKLWAQIQVLPDLEVSGESQVKIFLYKKALPYSQESSSQDSLRAFVPQSLPSSIPYPELEVKHPFQHYVYAAANSRMGLDSEYKFMPNNKNLSFAGLGLSLRAPKGNLLSNHFLAYGAYRLDSGEDLALYIKHYNADGSGIESDFSSASFFVYKDHIPVKYFDINKMSNEFVALYKDQDNRGLTNEHSSLGFRHQSELSFHKIDIGSRINAVEGRSSWQIYAAPEIEFFDKISMNFMYDCFRFMPALGFNWRYITDFDQQFSITNDPIININSYAEGLEKYRWLFYNTKPLHSMVPINLCIRLEDFMPLNNKSFIRSFAIQNHTQFRYDDMLLRDSFNTDIPVAYYENVFLNSTGIDAGFGQGKFEYDQSLSINLSYRSQQNWIRKAYEPLVKAQSAIRYKAFPYTIELSLDQHYFSLDHHQKALSEVFDLSIKGNYEFDKYSNVFIQVANMLNSKIVLFDSLPRMGVTLHAGISHRF
ncbi:MAG: hypothetical protein LHW48_11570 [Candidatus Cloacimonetes bacterium]|nr:hypothetical protein [Candidatus Cloacimonadota bacterium]